MGQLRRPVYRWAVVAIASVAILAIVVWRTAGPKVRINDLPELEELLLTERVKGMGWSLAYSTDPGEFAPIDVDEVIDELKSSVPEFIRKSSERALVWDFRGEAADALSWLKLVGGHLTHFLSPKFGAVRYFNYDGRLGVLISGLSIGVEFNTINTTELQRAQRVVYDMLVPEVGNVGKSLASTQAEWVAISLTYGARDFTSRSSLGSEEQTIVLFPQSSVTKYARGSITDAELVRQSIVFSGRVGSVRRFDLNR